MERKARDGQNEEFENFQQLLNQALSVPKEELDRRRAEHERKKKGRKKRAGRTR